MNNKTNCPECGASPVTPYQGNFFVRYGYPSQRLIPVFFTAFRCPSCGFEFRDHTSHKTIDRQVKDYVTRQAKKESK